MGRDGLALASEVRMKRVLVVGGAGVFGGA